MNVQDLKQAWLLVVDGKLNHVCKTNVDEKEMFQEWRAGWSWDWYFDQNLILGVLSKRLKSVYEDRIALRGYTIGCDYKTLKEEQEMNSGNPGQKLELANVNDLVHGNDYKLVSLCGFVFRSFPLEPVQLSVQNRWLCIRFSLSENQGQLLMYALEWLSST